MHGEVAGSMRKLFKVLGDAFLDHKGGVSAMRIMTVVICLVVLGAWLAGMIVEGRYIPLGYAEAGLIGAASGAKAVQSRFELGNNGLRSFEEE